MAGRNHLYIPGPTNVPNEVLNAMHVPMEDHRSPVFPKLFAPLLEDLKKVFAAQAPSFRHSGIPSGDSHHVAKVVVAL